MPPEFNPSFQSPDWAWWIVLYFFVGGVTGGVYFTAALLDLFGDRGDRTAIRLGHLIAFPLLILSAVCLIVDLGVPTRFWHMIFQSEHFPTPILKPYSPMSLGSAILAVFGLISFLSFIDAALFGHRLVHAVGSPLGKVVSALGALVGLGLAGYTGALLNATNEPVWSDSPWITALFVFSGVSTGIATLLLLTRRVSRATRQKLAEADNYLMVLELITLLAFLFTLGAVGARFVIASPVVVLFGVVIVLGLLVPLGLLWRFRRAHGTTHMATTLASVLVLLGGLVLRWAVLAGPQGVGL
jgi:formate-dependent nitrite reductase membrane component NrfD